MCHFTDQFALCSIKPGKIVIVLSGRYAGKKAVIVKVFEEGTKELKFPHALVAGIDRAPLKVSTFCVAILIRTSI